MKSDCGSQSGGKKQGNNTDSDEDGMGMYSYDRMGSVMSDLSVHKKNVKNFESPMPIRNGEKAKQQAAKSADTCECTLF